MKRTVAAFAVVALTSLSAVSTASAATLTVKMPCGCLVLSGQEIGVPPDSPAFDNGSARPGNDVKAGAIVTFE